MDCCVYCGEQIFPDDENISNSFGIAHAECAESEDPEELN